MPDLKNRVTLTRHFAANGYQTYTTGKIYHGSGLPQGDFDVVGPRPGQMSKTDDDRQIAQEVVRVLVQRPGQEPRRREAADHRQRLERQAVPQARW